MSTNILPTPPAPAVSDAEIHTWLGIAADAYPYYARGFAALTPIRKVVSPCGTPTLAVDKHWRLYWSPEALKHLSDAGGHPAALLCHELEHLLREHDARRHHRHPMAWNVAGDCEINDDLPAHQMPMGCPTLEPHGETAEHYYDQLAEAAEQHQHACGGGSGAGNPLEDEEPAGGPGDAPAVTDAPTLLDEIARDVVAAPPGTVPGHATVWAQARVTTRPVLPCWRQALRRRIREWQRGAADYSYARMSRRQDGSKIILPATVRPVLSIAVVLDTSGSMGGFGDWVASCLNEISRTGIRAELIDCDAEVHQRRPLRSWRDVLKSRGGGGTDMRAGIAAAGRELCIVLTDGETPWPEPWPRNLIAMVHDGKRTTVRTR